jgi:hypothetical protein
VILGDGENDVAIAVVFDLRERTLVSGKQNRPHVCGVSTRRGMSGLMWREVASRKFGDSRYRWFGV